jgi:hypothetical protein
MLATASKNRRLNIHDGFWLCLAVGLHALLLLIPFAHESAKKPADDTVIVKLLTEKKQAQTLFKITEPPIPDAPAPETLSDPLPQAEQKMFAEQEDMVSDIPAKPSDLPSTARLLDSASRVEWFPEEKTEFLDLGVSSSRSIPDYLKAHMGDEDNLFNGMVAPRKTEVVDRWLAADGSHNVVIHTSAGHTFCGRALAWDPMRPLVEHVMQFRPCGGGGKRSFDMPRRQAPPTEFIQVANSTTN